MIPEKNVLLEIDPLRIVALNKTSYFIHFICVHNWFVEHVFADIIVLKQVVLLHLKSYFSRKKISRMKLSPYNDMSYKRNALHSLVIILILYGNKSEI